MLGIFADRLYARITTVTQDYGKLGELCTCLLEELLLVNSPLCVCHCSLIRGSVTCNCLPSPLQCPISRWLECHNLDVSPSLMLQELSLCFLSLIVLSLGVILYLSMSEKTTDTSRPEDPVCTQPWEAFRSRNKLQPRYDWHQAKIPVELQTVPDDNEAPEKLKQIIAWSLLQVHPPPTPITQDKAEENIDKSGTTICDVGDITTIGQSLLPEPTKDEDVADSHSVSPAPTVEKPSGPRKRRPNAHHYNISQGLFASTLDLITTFKPKAEKDNRAQDSTNRELHVECVSCFDEFLITETPTLPCTHSYCKTCLKELVLTALRTESSFPPKCCLTEIPLQTVLLPLDKKQREAYKEKAAEYAVPAEERWYCPNTKCLKWIPPRKASRFMNSSQRCSHCSTRICVICRGISHRRLEECPQDYGLEATLSLAEMEGWRRCFKCRALVEVCITPLCAVTKLNFIAHRRLPAYGM